jgi:hypothetical protein
VPCGGASARRSCVVMAVPGLLRRCVRCAKPLWPAAAWLLPAARAVECTTVGLLCRCVCSGSAWVWRCEALLRPAVPALRIFCMGHGMCVTGTPFSPRLPFGCAGVPGGPTAGCPSLWSRKGCVAPHGLSYTAHRRLGGGVGWGWGWGDTFRAPLLLAYLGASQARPPTACPSGLSPPPPCIYFDHPRLSVIPQPHAP